MTKHDPLQTLAGRLTAQKLTDESVFERIAIDEHAYPRDTPYATCLRTP